MRFCPPWPHSEAIGSQLNMPKGLFILSTFQKLGNLVYLVPNYM